MKQHVVRGYTETFYARVYDVGNELITPDSITAYLIPPGSAYPGSGELTVTKQALGIYGAEVSIPVTASTGDWEIYWRIVISGETYNESEKFIVDPAPDLHFDSEVLMINQEYTLTIDESIRDSLGNTLTADENIFFYTELYPMYCSVEDIRLEIGSEISSIPDFTIALRIWKASMYADNITYISVPASGKRRNYYNFAREQFVKAKAIADVLMLTSHGSGGGYKKVLGDLEVTKMKDTSKGPNLVEDWLNEYKGWKWVVENGGEMTPGSGHKPGIATKGGWHPNRPNIGRGWIVGHGANTRTQAEDTTGGTKTKAKNVRAKYINWEATHVR